MTTRSSKSSARADNGAGAGDVGQATPPAYQWPALSRTTAVMAAKGLPPTRECAMSFTPELGQACFTNSPWHEVKLPDAYSDVLAMIGHDLDVMLRAGNPASNSGASYECDVFKMRSYCWCDGGTHPNGCPPNFEWRDWRVAWYKHAGRGASCNRLLTHDELVQMRAEVSRHIYEVQYKRMYGREPE